MGRNMLVQYLHMKQHNVDVVISVSFMYSHLLSSVMLKG